MIQTLLSSLVSIPRLLAIVQSVNDTRVKSFLLSCSTIVVVISWEKDLRGMICWADKKNLALWHLKHPFWKWYIILKWMPWKEGILKSPIFHMLCTLDFIFNSEQFHLSIITVIKLFTWNCWKVQPNYLSSKYSIQLSLNLEEKLMAQQALICLLHSNSVIANINSEGVHLIRHIPTRFTDITRNQSLDILIVDFFFTLC